MLQRLHLDRAKLSLIRQPRFVTTPLAEVADPLFASFQEPPARLRPFVRWWWNGSRVAEAEILRELDLLKAAGVGGVEINTIAPAKILSILLVEVIEVRNKCNQLPAQAIVPDTNFAASR